MRDISSKQNNMREISILKNRILQYIENKNISKYEFYQKTGISNGILSQKNGLSEDNILKFLSYFTDINSEWLLTGKGEMLKTDNENNDEISVVALIDSVRMQKKIDSLELKIKRLEALNESYREEIKELKKDMATLEKKSN